MQGHRSIYTVAEKFALLSLGFAVSRGDIGARFAIGEADKVQRLANRREERRAKERMKREGACSL